MSTRTPSLRRVRAINALQRLVHAVHHGGRKVAELDDDLRFVGHHVRRARLHADDAEIPDGSPAEPAARSVFARGDSAKACIATPASRRIAIGVVPA